MWGRVGDVARQVVGLGVKEEAQIELSSCCSASRVFLER